MGVARMIAGWADRSESDNFSVLLGYEDCFLAPLYGGLPALFSALAGASIGGPFQEIRRKQAGIRLAPALGMYASQCRGVGQSGPAMRGALIGQYNGRQ